MWLWLSLMVGIAFLAGVIGGSIAGSLVTRLEAEEPASSLLPTPINSYVTITEETAISDVVTKVEPSVVTVVNTLSSPTGLPLSIEETATGSGVIIDENGYILTNEHTVSGSRELMVILPSGEKMPAQLIGTDYPYTDLAIIKIQSKNISPARLGDSNALKVGQRVVAIGSALGYLPTSVTQGVISGLHRSWNRDGLIIEDLIQTDAALNFGNSGGPLINLAGDVIGINTVVIRRSNAGEAAEGLGFAIPSNTAAVIARQLISRGKVSRPYLGISHRDITPTTASLYGLAVNYGAYITQVSSGSPAARAGLKEEDVITKIGEIPLDDQHPFLNVLMKFEPKEKVPITINRAGKDMIVEVTLTERP
ncbi:MAG: trypsin-like peptidase domain-containing protein [Chloroflexi bacterium]|nr:trypsin-like peptidase domain-containing protein [Chloroflexota bacterium]